MGLPCLTGVLALHWGPEQEDVVIRGRQASAGTWGCWSPLLPPLLHPSPGLAGLHEQMLVVLLCPAQAAPGAERAFSMSSADRG